MKKFYSLLALMFLGTSILSAQTFPCGEQVLSDCYCLGSGTLVADSEPCSFGTAESQIYILVDVNDATVDGDADDDSIVSVSSNGTFSGVPTGDYVAYQFTYSNSDQSNVEMLTEVGGSFADLDAQFGSGLTSSSLATVNAPDCNCPDYGSTGNLTDDNGNSVSGVEVIITDSEGNIVATTVTDENGNFGFDNIPDGDYIVDVTYPEGYAGDSSFSISVIDGASSPIVSAPAFDETVCESLVAEATILANNDGTYNVIITLNFEGQSGGFTVSSSNGYNGQVSGSFVDGSFPNLSGFDYTITSNDIPGCSVTLFANSVDISTTPVELARFDAEAIETGNNVSWETASETNNDYFTLEYSVDGINFKPIAKVNGNGSTSTSNTYSFLHTTYESPVSFYRLSQTDFDGVSKYVGGVIRVERTIEVLTLTNVFPIPANETINVEFLTAKSGTATVEMFDLTGKLISTVSINTVKGANVENFDISQFATGTYFISITTGNEQITAKFMKN